MQERRELEDNYVHFKTVFGSHSPTKGSGLEKDSPTTSGGLGSDTSPNEFDETNPFFEEERESNPFAEGEDEDESANNPFF